MASSSLDEGFDLLLDWLDAYPDRDVTVFPGWREPGSKQDEAAVTVIGVRESRVVRRS